MTYLVLRVALAAAVSAAGAGPATVQTPAVLLVKLTGRPELAEAARAKGGVPIVLSP